MKIIFRDHSIWTCSHTCHVQHVANLMQRIFGGGHIPTEI